MNSTNKTVIWNIGRDAGTGRLEPVKVARHDPKGAVVETMRRPASPQPKCK